MPHVPPSDIFTRRVCLQLDGMDAHGPPSEYGSVRTASTVARHSTLSMDTTTGADWANATDEKKTTNADTVKARAAKTRAFMAPPPEREL